MGNDIEQSPAACDRPKLARLLVCLSIGAAGTAWAVWLGRGLRLSDPGTLSPLAATAMWAGFSLALARIVWRWEAFAADLLVFALVTPFCLDRARAAAAEPVE